MAKGEKACSDKIPKPWFIIPQQHNPTPLSKNCHSDDAEYNEAEEEPASFCTQVCLKSAKEHKTRVTDARQREGMGGSPYG
jgi:hypothetical protein